MELRIESTLVEEEDPEEETSVLKKALRFECDSCLASPIRSGSGAFV